MDLLISQKKNKEKKIADCKFYWVSNEIINISPVHKNQSFFLGVRFVVYLNNLTSETNVIDCKIC